MHDRHIIITSFETWSSTLVCDARFGVRSEMSLDEVVPMEETATNRLGLSVSHTIISQPSKFTGRGGIMLWLKWFELYAKRASIPTGEWAKEHLLLLEDKPFCMVCYLGFVDSDIKGLQRI